MSENVNDEQVDGVEENPEENKSVSIENKAVSEGVTEESANSLLDSQVSAEDYINESSEAAETEVTESKENDAESGELPLDVQEGDPEYVKKRLARQKRSHDKKINDTQRENLQLKRMVEDLQTRAYGADETPQEHYETQEPEQHQEADPNDHAALVEAAIDKRIAKAQRAQEEEVQKKQESYYLQEISKVAEEIQLLTESLDEEEQKVCHGKLDTTMLENAARLPGGSDILVNVCRDGSWQSLKNLPPFKQARKMQELSKELGNGTQQKVQSDAPHSKGRPSVRGGTAVSTSIMNLSTDELVNRMRKGTL